MRKMIDQDQDLWKKLVKLAYGVLSVFGLLTLGYALYLLLTSPPFNHEVTGRTLTMQEMMTPILRLIPLQLLICFFAFSILILNVLEK